MTNQLALIIEDEPYASEIFSKALQKAGFETEAILDGGLALTRLAAAVPAVIVLDINLPSVSGGDILQFVRADPRLAKIHVIITTAGPHLLSDAIRKNADLILVKPVSYNQLRDLAIRLYSDGASKIDGT
jgi:CheY-like chemotaxis protein